ncbi:MAG: hypothetical protein GY862_13655 [Gammaproteobacteria bacterium]|nr:hypothetical protein [Gammaproteobacteria bacterium]
MEGTLINVFNERGIPVQHTVSRTCGVYEGDPWELDIVAKKRHEVIVVEVKTTLRPDDVKNFLKKLKRARRWMSEYADNTLYGAVAWITADTGAEQMAQNKGLFSIKAVGGSARIENIENIDNFTPVYIRFFSPFLFLRFGWFPKPELGSERNIMLYL